MVRYFQNLSKAERYRLAVVVGLALLVTAALKALVGMGWAFLLLAALWFSGNMVAWFRRHPPPPSSYRGGRRSDD